MDNDITEDETRDSSKRPAMLRAIYQMENAASGETP